MDKEKLQEALDRVWSDFIKVKMQVENIAVAASMNNFIVDFETGKIMDINDLKNKNNG